MMHQSYEYDVNANQATVTKEDISPLSWFKRKVCGIKENVAKRNQRKTVLNAVADALIEEQKVVEVDREKPKSRLEKVVSQATS
jgi:hypothetical protein